MVLKLNSVLFVVCFFSYMCPNFLICVYHEPLNLTYLHKNTQPRDLSTTTIIYTVDIQMKNIHNLYIKYIHTHQQIKHYYEKIGQYGMTRVKFGFIIKRTMSQQTLLYNKNIHSHKLYVNNHTYTQPYLQNQSKLQCIIFAVSPIHVL